MQNRHEFPIKVVCTQTTEIAEAFGYRDRILGIENGHRLPRGRLRNAYRRGWADADHFSLDVMAQFHLNNYWLLRTGRRHFERLEAERVDP